MLYKYCLEREIHWEFPPKYSRKATGGGWFVIAVSADQYCVGGIVVVSGTLPMITVTGTPRSNGVLSTSNSNLYEKSSVSEIH